MCHSTSNEAVKIRDAIYHCRLMPNACHTVHTEELGDMERRLSTILAADVVGYSARMGEVVKHTGKVFGAGQR